MQAGVSTPGVFYGFTINGQSFTVEGSGDVGADLYNATSELNWVSADRLVGASEIGPGAGIRLFANDGRNIPLTETAPGAAALFGLGRLAGGAGRGGAGRGAAVRSI